MKLKYLFVLIFVIAVICVLTFLLRLIFDNDDFSLEFLCSNDILSGYLHLMFPLIIAGWLLSRRHQDIYSCQMISYLERQEKSPPQKPLMEFSKKTI